MQNLFFYLVFASILLGGLFIHSQTVFADPPSWAPAHGYRAKHHKHKKHKHVKTVEQVYYYYPTQQVYFSPQSQQYFWLQAGTWAVGLQLPSSIQIGSASPLSLNLATNQPYTQHAWVKQKYPVQ